MKSMFRAMFTLAMCAGLLAASFDFDDRWVSSQAAGRVARCSVAGSAPAATPTDSETPVFEQGPQGRGDLSRESRSRSATSHRTKALSRVLQLARAGLRPPRTRDLPEVLLMHAAGASLPALHVRLQI